MFYRGFKNTVKDKIILYDKLNIINKFIILIIKINNK